MARVRHIVIATDLTERAERAVDRGLQLCRDIQASTVTLLHVVSEGLPPDVEAQHKTAAEAVLATRVSQWPTQSSSVSVNAIVCAGYPFSTIISQAIARAADLVVIGAPSMHRNVDLFTGTTAERVIRFNDRPILMVKQVANGPYRRVLVAFDGSEGAVRSLHMGIRIAPKAEFRVIHAWRSPHVAFGDAETARQVIDDHAKRLNALVDEVSRQSAEDSHDHAAHLSFQMIEENPYRAISNECVWADLLVMGTHSRGRLASTATVGGLARHLLVESPCDVLISRP